MWTTTRPWIGGLAAVSHDLICTSKMPLDICAHPTVDPIPQIIYGCSVGLIEEIGSRIVFTQLYARIGAHIDSISSVIIDRITVDVRLRKSKDPNSIRSVSGDGVAYNMGASSSHNLNPVASVILNSVGARC